MSEPVHGHEVLEMLLASPEPTPIAALRDAAGREFGADARYYTCAASDMTLDELVEFLLMRRKVTETDGGLVAHREEMCDHS